MSVCTSNTDTVYKRIRPFWISLDGGCHISRICVELRTSAVKFLGGPPGTVKAEVDVH